MYEQLLDFCDNQGLEFPCTAHQFHARVMAFLKALGRKPDNQEIGILMSQGVGPDWQDD